MPTQAGVFRADFLLVAGSQITLIECDGASFHADPFDDHLRSAFIMDAGLVDQVIRFNGTMLHHYSPQDAALWTTAVAPSAFWAGAETNVTRAATREGVAALLKHQADLRSGHCDFIYDALTEDTDRSFNEDPRPHRSTFVGSYHSNSAVGSRAGELLATLQRSRATTLEDLERAYWAEEKSKGAEASAAFWASVYGLNLAKDEILANPVM